MPSTPARLRVAAPLPEGPGPPCRGSRGTVSSCPEAAPSIPPAIPGRAVVPKVPKVLTRCLLLSSPGWRGVSGRMHTAVASCMPLALRCPMSRPTLPRLASAPSRPQARPLGHSERAPIQEVTLISLERLDSHRPRPSSLNLGDTISYLHLILQALVGPAFVHCSRR